ncbi:hypothetical protein KUTeg_018507 [Tegillarca granosa]|uniref:Sushi domain-containing protein n=1 Tax=Tegillarca granosa TaxID=220873 RepID=A0ABQ9EHY6_TEGGR|nr:hypothetical protein KUTeg_018507 [Tegillarca granosa]
MFCKTGYDIPPGHPAYEMFVCGLSNMWKPDITLPNCHRKIGTIGVGIRMSAHYYFDGDCHNKAVILAIQESFILNLKASPYTDGCLVFAKTCSPENVEVQCGVTKKKRSVGLGIGFSFVIKFHNQNLSLDSFFTNISTQSMNLDLEINGSRYTAYDIQSSSYEVLCPDLTIPSQNHMACVICAPGSYFDKKKKTCPQCPKGMYQPMEGKEECVKCPDGTTTKSIGSKYNTSCKESCLPGSISHDGLPPCSLCKKGTYQDTYGNSSCKMCSGSKTTQTDGSSLAKECQEFDISIKDENGSFTVALQSLDVDMNFGFYISTWMMFESEASSAEILEFISSNKTSLASLSNKRTLFFSNMSNHYNMSFLVDKYKWHNYLLYLNKSNVVLFVDGSSTSNAKIGLDNIGTANLIKVGGYLKRCLTKDANNY